LCFVELQFPSLLCFTLKCISVCSYLCDKYISVCYTAAAVAVTAVISNASYVAVAALCLSVKVLKELTVFMFMQVQFAENAGEYKLLVLVDKKKCWVVEKTVIFSRLKVPNYQAGLVPCCSISVLC